MRFLRVLTMVLAMLAGGVGLSANHAPPASACSCIGFTFEEAVDNADLIARVRAIRVLGEDGGYVSYRLAVEEVWKGEHTNTIIMNTHEQVPACGLGRVIIGDSWRLWAMGGDGEYSASWCLLPSDVSADEMGGRLGEYLGDPVPMEPYAGSAFDGPWVGPTLIAIGLLMCAGVVVVLVVSGRSRSR